MARLDPTRAGPRSVQHRIECSGTNSPGLVGPCAPNMNDHKWNCTIDAGRRQLQALVRRRHAASGDGAAR
jgi:hypothetical protein